MSKARKVLYVVPDGDDLGGIYTSTENLLCGFAETGHYSTLALIRPAQTHRATPIGPPLPGSFVGPGSEWPLHPIRGWKAPYYSWGDDASLKQLIELGNKHDLVVWGAMFGLRNHLTEGHDRWTRVFSEIKRPHVGMIRDDHLQDRYPWVTELERWIVGWACVQQSSLDSCVGLRRPRAWVSSGHDLGDLPKRPTGLAARTRQVFSLQTFKSWKKVDRLVMAAPYLRQSKVVVILAGDGIERCYMSSQTKCKDRYYCSRDRDPDADKTRLGKPIWRNALQAGMKYLGPVTPEQRDQRLRSDAFFVDLSYRGHSTGQTNRTIVEAIKQGCVPLAIPKFISGNDEGKGLFQSGRHYLPLDHDCSPKLLAEAIVDYFGSMKHAAYSRMQMEGRELIEQFDRKVAAQRLVGLAMGTLRTKVYDPKPDAKLLARGEREFQTIFGGGR